MKILFWILFCLIFYAYCGYPVLLAVVALFRARAVRKAAFEPTVSVIIAAYNEERHIRDKIAATLALDYPASKLEVIVVSDGSTDATVEEAQRCKSRRVRVLALAGRKGKTHAQNRAAGVAFGDILVFSDATTVYAPRTIRALVGNFADRSVGAVGGELRYVNSGGSAAGQGEGLYWKYERMLKRMESGVCSLIGVSGCCYAVRRKAYDAIPDDLISDFVIAQLVYRKGMRTVYEPGAVSYEEANSTFTEEFAMRIRVAVRSLHGLWRMRGLLNPVRHGFFSVALLSHKVLRYMIPVFLMVLLGANFCLLGSCRERAYVILFTLQLAFYGLAAAGFLLRGKRYISIPFYFFITNAALMVGFMRFLMGERQVVWKPLRH